MSALENLEAVTGLKRQEMDSIFQEVKANSKALDECVGTHDFSVCLDRRTKQEIQCPTPQQRFGCKWRCWKCGGVIDGINKGWYEKGLKHSKP